MPLNAQSELVPLFRVQVRSLERINLCLFTHIPFSIAINKDLITHNVIRKESTERC